MQTTVLCIDWSVDEIVFIGIVTLQTEGQVRSKISSQDLVFSIMQLLLICLKIGGKCGSGWKEACRDHTEDTHVSINLNYCILNVFTVFVLQFLMNLRTPSTYTMKFYYHLFL